ncbi:MAG: molybdopterin oxidoreductase [Halioglobus sp.]|nr:molybdopterin oxidoreductase [Halioglobus sp.]
MAAEADNVRSSACNLCFVNCGIKVELGGEDGRRFVKVRGDDQHPTSRGYICNKAARIDYYQNSGARLDSPMRRRADGSYEAVDWDTAIREVAARLAAVKARHGGERIFYYGGGAQGNHLVGASAMGLRGALGVKYMGNAISQEKTGLAWVVSRMVGGMTHPELHRAQVAVLVGKNPFMSNGMDRARPLLKDIRNDPARSLVVIDPRRTETADYADIHLAVRPGRDAWCMAAIVGHIVQADLVDRDWLAAHASGHEAVIAALADVPVDEYARFAGLDPQLVQRAARLIGTAESVALEEDLGIQMAPHSTLVTYLNHLAVLLTGNYGRPGTMGMITQLAQVISLHRARLDENGRDRLQRLPVTGAPIISGLYPGSYLAEEILNDHPERARALVIESANPVHSLPGAPRLREAIRSLEFSLCVDVAMTETARECDYVLPASSTYEKWEATFFPRNFPANIFHLRKPLLSATPNTLGEPEIHARIIEAMGLVEPGELDTLHAAAAQGQAAYRDAFFAAISGNAKLAALLPYVLYRTLGPTLGEGAEATAIVWGLCQVYTLKHAAEAARAGWEGPDAGLRLFAALRDADSAVVIGESTYQECFERIPHPDQRLQLHIPELLEEAQVLRDMRPLLDTSADYPFALVAGSRRAYTANCAIRDPRWAKGRDTTALTIHPDDGARYALPEGARVRLETAVGSALVDLAYDARMQPGTASLPNGQGMLFRDEQGKLLSTGVYANELTDPALRDRFAGTPLHKFVPARLSLA